jgi:predicted nucleotidyltransferase
MLAKTVARVNAVVMLHARPPLRLAEICRAADVQQTVAESALSTLERRGVIVHDRPHAYDLFSPDVEGPYYQAALRTALVDIDIRGSLPTSAAIRRIHVFGSVPDGRATSESDLDVLIIGKMSEREAAVALRPLGMRIGRDVDVVVRTSEQVADAEDAGDAFIAAALAGPCVWRSDRRAVRTSRRQPERIWRTSLHNWRAAGT